MTPRLKITYDKEIISKLMTKLSLKNKHEVPKIIKIVLNMGLGEDASDGKKLKPGAKLAKNAIIDLILGDGKRR